MSPTGLPLLVPLPQGCPRPMERVMHPERAVSRLTVYVSFWRHEKKIGSVFLLGGEGRFPTHRARRGPVSCHLHGFDRLSVCVCPEMSPVPAPRRGTGVLVLAVCSAQGPGSAGPRTQAGPACPRPQHLAACAGSHPCWPCPREGEVAGSVYAEQEWGVGATGHRGLGSEVEVRVTCGHRPCC